MKRPLLNVNFSGFWNSFEKTNNFFYNLLVERYDVHISDNPDLLFYTDSSTDHIKYNCTKVFYTGENIRPNFILCDFAFSFDYSKNRRNYRLPLYALYHDVQKLVDSKLDFEAIMKDKKKFCCFLVSNPKCKIRNDFFHQLSTYKTVDSGGKVFNNIGYLVEDKWEFIREYKFVIAFENTSHPGYTTEKIYEPFINNCIPIYWGDPLVINDFNDKRFINCNDYKSFEEVMEEIIKLDQDDTLYIEYLKQPVFVNDELNEFVKKENILRQLDKIIEFHFQNKFSFNKLIRKPYFKCVDFIITTVFPFNGRLIQLPKNLLYRLKLYIKS
jgi:hypothetical protein